MSRFQALIFDFDGLIVDTEYAVFEMWRQIFSEWGTELLLENWIACVGTYNGPFNVYSHLAECSGKTVDREAMLPVITARKAAITADLPLMPGVTERLQEARALGWKVGVASSSARDWVESGLRRRGVYDSIDVIRTRDDVKRTKPDPELYLSAAAGLGIEPTRCVVLEDSLNGVLAAKAAGAYAVAVPNRITKILNFAPADRQVASLMNLSLAAL